MTATHTPGPWHVALDPQVIGARRQLGAPFEKVATVSYNLPAEEWIANARLIAAAPELLAALEGLRAELRAHVKLNVRKHYSLMVADAAAGTAIAKARGKG